MIVDKVDTFVDSLYEKSPELEVRTLMDRNDVHKLTVAVRSDKTSEYVLTYTLTALDYLTET
jgi:hypothetical protein